MAYTGGNPQLLRPAKGGSPQGAALIIKPRDSRNHRPKFRAEFGVAEEEPDGPGF